MRYVSSVAAAIVVTVFCFAVPARAGILIEPYVGYNLLASTMTFGAGAGGALDGQSVKLSDTGLGYGLRLGYSLPMVFFAADYSMSNLSSSVTEKPAGSTVTTEASTGTSLGVTVGLDLPLLRPYVGYILDDQVKNDSATTSGSGFKAGIGISMLPLIRVNLEYLTRTWTKSKSSSGVEESFGSAATYKSVSDSGLFLNLSIPFSL